MVENSSIELRTVYQEIEEQTSFTLAVRIALTYCHEKRCRSGYPLGMSWFEWTLLIGKCRQAMDLWDEAACRFPNDFHGRFQWITPRLELMGMDPFADVIRQRSGIPLSMFLQEFDRKQTRGDHE